MCNFLEKCRLHIKYISLFLIVIILASCDPTDNSLHGYVEGEFVLISPTSSGLLQTLSVKRGQKIKSGDPLFSLDTTELALNENSTIADLEQAKAKLRDISKGERPEEVEVILKQKEQAQINVINTKKEYIRILDLTKKGTMSQSSLDNATAAYDGAKAKLEELNAKLKVADLGARTDQISVAKEEVTRIEQLLAQIKNKLNDAAPIAPFDGIVQDTYFNPGEYIATGKPVVSLLSPENIKIRFFIPQKLISFFHLDKIIKVKCDSCSNPITAKISYISSEVEYTPPVIYSIDSRDKLVFLVEAKIIGENDNKLLPPGLPVDIEWNSK